MQYKCVDDTYRNAAKLLIRLLSGAMNSCDPGVLISDSGEEFAVAADIAFRNGVDGLAFCAFKYMPNPPQGEVYEALKKGWERTCYRQLCYDEERGEILKEMQRAGLSYLPLKGILHSEYYPEPGMRFMGDNDILYGFTSVSESGQVCRAGKNETEISETQTRASDIMRGIMLDRGYGFIDHDGSIHDSFIKKPIFCFEMHRELISRTNKFRFYYADPWSRAIHGEDGCFSFSDEDEYIYNLIHEIKHIESCGSGIRFFADIYVFLKKKGKKLDWEYILRELESLGLVQTEERLRNIALAAFGTPDNMTPEQEEELLFHMGCGMYGTVETRTKILLDRLKKEKGTNGLRLNYIKSRLFLPDEVNENAFPKIYSNRFLRPFIPLYRVLSAVIRRPEIIFTEIRELFSSNKKS